MRRKVPLLTAILLAVTALLPLAPAGADTGAGSREKPVGGGITWSPCPEDPAVECGRLAVPVDWAAPGGPTVEIALARRKATDPAARIGAMLINPGGPGGSGVDFALAGAEYFSQEISRRFDIVGFDPRGVARSHPVVCSADLLARAPYPIMKSQADFDGWLAYNRQLREDCRARTGPLYDHVDTLSVVRDMDAVRAALGERRLTYYGRSYGTLMGQLYAETFPHRVRALALDSNMDHSLGTRAFLDTESAAAQDSFDEFAAWCGREADCALHGRDLRAVWADLLTRAGRGELRFPGAPEDVPPLTQLGLISIAFGGFYGPEWAQLAELLLALDTGTEPPAGVLPRPAVRSTEVSAGASAEVSAFPPRVFCLDYHLPIRDYREYAAHLRRSAKIAPDMRYSPLAFSMTAFCLGQPAPIPNPQHPLRVRGAAPLLLGNALHDPATGYDWALGTARQLGRQAVLLTYEGWGHGVYNRSECTLGAFDGYLIGLTPPARGTRCPAVPPAEAQARQRSWPGPSGPLPNLPGWSLSPRPAYAG
ncbi:alpha/beta fold hydrolase [Planobispora siamensis]|uniref:Peptidase n=1 Tax=Planobispora siamensis TaxID=936338 RepID=A0A8J3SPX3_9ACTN|nr:alpha/beta fold hydrolase [Planobispora siamensis]GIH97320.1 peptidase [Planobispora siamensis]